MVDFRREIEKPEYDFLRENDHLGSNVCLLTVGGSHAYGTSVEGSDIDIRGCALNSAMEILTGTGFEQVINNETDTTIYSFNKLVFGVSVDRMQSECFGVVGVSAGTLSGSGPCRRDAC